MKAAVKIKMMVDVSLLVMLPVLMAEILTGQEVHEWLGTAMAVVLILHHLLNINWLKNIGKGNYTPLRSLITIINLLLFADMSILMISGIVMSGFVFEWLPISGGMILSRRLHLFTSHWGLILMALHTGVHWSRVVRLGTKFWEKSESEDELTWLARGLATAISIFGVYAFIQQNMSDYLFLKTAFVFWDETKTAVSFLIETLSIMGLFITIGYYGQKRMKGLKGMKHKTVKYLAFLIPILVCIGTIYWMITGNRTSLADSWETTPPVTTDENYTQSIDQKQKEDSNPSEVNDGYVLISGGTFLMGSPESEAWRGDDEQQHTVTVSDFYMSPYEVTQEDYEALTGNNPSSFEGTKLPVDSISWTDAITYCNLMSEQAGLTPAYQTDGNEILWNRSANGYRLPTEAEWEYACRAGTTTPFHTKDSISAEESNYWGNYPYMIEDNYFNQSNLETRPGTSRYETVPVDSFEPNLYGLYNMHGNVGEWVWDLYGAYDSSEQINPAGADTGNLHISRGGGWNDFAKNVRSAYRATSQGGRGVYNIGIRLVRGAVPEGGILVSGQPMQKETGAGNVLIAYFSWGGNTREIAEEIAEQTGADLFEITCIEPYSTDYNTVLQEAQRDQNTQARPELAAQVENMEQYDTILLGYPNWWASIPMPVASFMEEYDFYGKTIIPFCSHGGGRFGQSLAFIAKLAPDAMIGEGLAISYSGGESLPSDVSTWLEVNKVKQ